jgi:hypothetical protein
MKPDRRVMAFLGSIVLAGTAMAADVARTRVPFPLPTRNVHPKEYGLTDDTITVVSATSFTRRQLGPNSPQCDYTPTFALDCDPNTDVHYYAGLDLPAGAVIDSIGLNSLTDTDGVIGMELWSRDDAGGTNPLAAFSVPAHASFATDYSGPLNVMLGSHDNHELVLDVETASNPNLQYFAWIEVWWHRSINLPLGAPTFNDVPPGDPGYDYIGALAASGITSGCGSGNFCPDAALTRRQMAVFLTKALGLHWAH